jgi:hypothetical protein
MMLQAPFTLTRLAGYGLHHLFYSTRFAIVTSRAPKSRASRSAATNRPGWLAGSPREPRIILGLADELWPGTYKADESHCGSWLEAARRKDGCQPVRNTCKRIKHSLLGANVKIPAARGRKGFI